MKRTYLEVGKQYNDTIAKQEKLNKAITTLEWLDLPANDFPFMQGFALKVMIKQMGNNPDKIAHGLFGNGLALLAMRNNYTKGKVNRATVYGLDTGTEVIMVAVDEETAADTNINS